MRRGKKIISVTLSLVLAAGLAGCGNRGSETEITETVEVDSVAVEAGTPRKGTLTVSATYIGTVSPQEQVSVIPLVSGEVAEVNYEVGDYVEAGSVLVRVDDDAVRLQLESAEIAKKSAELSAQKTLGSTQDLSNISSMSNIMAIQNQITAAQRQYETALDSVESSYQAKEDLKESLEDIDDSIDDLKDDYKKLKDLASAAKNLVIWDGDEWGWITDYYYPASGRSGEGNNTTPGSYEFEMPNFAFDDSSTGGSSGSTDNIVSNDKEDDNEETSGDEPYVGEETSGDEPYVDEETSNDEPHADAKDVNNNEGVIYEDTDDSQTIGISLRNKNYIVSPLVRFKRNDKAQSLRSDVQGSYAVINIVSADNPEEMDPGVWQSYYAQVSAIKSLGYTAKDIGEGKLDTAVTTLKTQIETLESQADSLKTSIAKSDTTIKSTERSAASAGDNIGLLENNLQAAQDAYDIQNGQAYEETKASLENQIAAANVGVESVQMQLENYVITAPISGQIEQKNVDEFGMVSAGNPVYVISNKDSMTITFYVSEAVKLQMAVGQSVTVERSEQNWTAAITQIGESVNSKTGLFEIKATVEGSDLTNGVSVKVHANTARTADALLIPYNAVYFSDEQAYVYCVENDTLVKVQVETGIYNEDTIEIKSGLTQDSVVVNTWSSRLMDGTKVHIEEAEE